jgi:1A family penicillin-binding protein
MIGKLFSLRALGILAGLAFVGVSFMVAGFFYISKNLPDVTAFDNRKIAESSRIYDRTGEVLLYEIHGEEKRSLIPFEEIPDLVKKATIAIEDAGFYEHSAFDWRGIFRAAIVNLKNLSIVQGGSTITQQLAKKAFLSDERTPIRKLKELILAFNLEKKYTKDRILGLYLNQIPYGVNAYGIASAARAYFGKQVKDLTLGEISILVSLPRGPSYYSPWGPNKDRLTGRQHLVLEKMKDLGYITDQQYENAINEEIKFAPQTTSIKAAHFVMMVLAYLEKQYGTDFIQTGGLKIITTLDWNMQELAEKVVADGAKRNQELYGGTNAALIAEDATTGQILAHVGSRNYFDEEIDGNFDVASQGLRQPGSTIKPFAYLAAFKKGFTPDTIVFDLETEFDATKEEDKSYKPQNFDEVFIGPVKLKQALSQSRNVPAVKTMYLAGLDNVLRLVKDFGISTLTERSRYGLSLVLGGGEVKLTELVHAYAVLSQEGIKRKQSIILRIEDKNGGILEEYSNSEKQVIDAQYVRLINDILSDTDLRRPLFANSLDLTLVPNQEIALKTGTTNDYRDAWTVGYTPNYVIGVWAGNNDNKPMVKRGSSILAAVPIWSAFAKAALADKPLITFNKPDPVFVEKPILRGEFIINNQIHDILYYVDKNEPLGPPPQNPDADSQFKNWEEPVLAWLASTSMEKIISENPNAIGSGTLSVDVQSPKNGDFIRPQQSIPLNLRISALADIASVEIYFNNKIIQQTQSTTLVKTGNIYNYFAEFTPQNTELQNSLKIKVTDTKNTSSEKELVLFK